MSSTDREFNLALDECLDRVLVKGESIEHCLTSYPQYAGDLEPLLRMAVEAKGSSYFTPSAQGKAAGWARVQASFHARQNKAEKRVAGSVFGNVLRNRWAMATVTSLLVVVFGMWGTVAASGGSVPGDALYPVKRASEHARVTLTRDSEEKARLYSQMADRRVQEMARVANKGDVEKVQGLRRDIQEYLGNVKEIVGKSERPGDGPAMTGPSPSPAATETARGTSPTATATQKSIAVSSSNTAISSQPTATSTPIREFGLTGGVIGAPTSTPTATPTPTPTPSPTATATATATATPAPKATAAATPTPSKELQKELSVELKVSAEKNLATLTAAMEKAPEQTKAALRDAITAIKADYEDTIAAASEKESPRVGAATPVASDR